MIVINNKTAFIVLFLFTLSFNTLADPDVQTGLWEIEIQTRMQGIPGGMPAIKRRQCITKKDLIPKSQDPGQDCKIENNSITGNTVNWSIKCQQHGSTMTGRGKITYKGDSYQGRINMKMVGGQMGEMNMEQDISGKRIGECN